MDYSPEKNSSIEEISSGNVDKNNQTQNDTVGIDKLTKEVKKIKKIVIKGQKTNKKTNVLLQKIHNAIEELMEFIPDIIKAIKPRYFLIILGLAIAFLTLVATIGFDWRPSWFRNTLGDTDPKLHIIQETPPPKYTPQPEPTIMPTPIPTPTSIPTPTPMPTHEPTPTSPTIIHEHRPLYDRSPSWRLYSEGTLVVGSGIIEWRNWWSPWRDFRDDISRIVFTGSISVIGSMRGFFHDLHNLTAIEGLWHLSSDDADYMSWVFRRVSSLTMLDLSGWDTSNWEFMRGMFESASSLANLNLSGWDTSSVILMDNMFYGTTSLRQLTLGENFRFVDHNYGNASLQNPPENTIYTGRWTNGAHSFTADELMTNPIPSLAGTWVWERR